MAKFRRGPAAAAEPKPTRQSYVRNIGVKSGEKKLIQLLPATLEERGDDEAAVSLEQDTITVLTHEWVITGERVPGKPRFDTLVSRKDKSLDGVDGYDPLWDKHDLVPKDVTWAVAVELEGEYKTERGRNKLKAVKPAMRTYTNREGEEIETPQIGVIAQKWSNFFAPLQTLVEDQDLDLATTVFAVVRTGSGTDTTYTWIAQPVEAVDMGEYKDDFIDLELHLENLADVSRIKELVENQPEGHVFNQYAEQDKKEKAAKAAASNKGKGKKKDKEEDAPWEEPEVDEFEALKASVGGSKEDE